jgi:hypothetical protein
MSPLLWMEKSKAKVFRQRNSPKSSLPGHVCGSADLSWKGWDAVVGVYCEYM